MNWQYISGFFDADGSVSLINANKNKLKALQISFHNNELSILQEIQSFIFNELNIKGAIIIKKAKKENHHDAYDLKYTYDNALILSSYLTSKHPKKQYRIFITLKYYKNLTPRNGKYTPKSLNRKLAFQRLFFMTPVS